MKNRSNKIFTFLVLTGFALCFFSTDVIGQTGSSEEVDQLVKDLQNESWQIRWDAAAALGEIKDPRAIDPLSKALQDENSYVRMTAARSLGMIEDKRVIAPLIQALKDDSHGVKKNAALSLKIRTGQDFGKDYEAWRRWWEQDK
jgi:HEAT repeat protein